MKQRASPYKGKNLEITKLIFNLKGENIMTLIQFIYSAKPEQIKTLQVKANALTGDITIPNDVTAITEALKNRLGLKTAQTTLARKLSYAANRRHYKYGTTMLQDILAGQTRRHANSYI